MISIEMIFMAGLEAMVPEKVIRLLEVRSLSISQLCKKPAMGMGEPKPDVNVNTGKKHGALGHEFVKDPLGGFGHEVYGNAAQQVLPGP